MNRPRSIFHKYRRTTLILFIVFSVSLILALAEIFFWMFLKFPSLNNYIKPVRTLMSDIYMDYDRDIAQFLPACSKYDSELTYTLKPGACILKNREYENLISINSQGLRDDEGSLNEPEIIILGDSHAFGYGLEQYQSFPELLEKMSGMKTLNAAVPSYGTVREIMMLGRLNKEKLKFLIIQYCSNDFEENESYMKNGFELENTSREIFEKVMDEHYSRTRYYPLLYTKSFLKHLKLIIDNKMRARKNAAHNHFPTKNFRLANFTPESKHESSKFTEALYFVNLISKASFSGQLIILKIDGNGTYNDGFEETVESIMHTGDYPVFIRDAKIIRTANIINSEDYYILDDHLNKYGHEKIAEELLKTIR